MKPPRISVRSHDYKSERRHKSAKSDQRRPFEVDRDRIQYSSAFHRLAGVTQIVRAGESGVFHTRQQHTYKVAQIGRRLAQYCQSTDERLAKKLGLDPEVVEAACLAHDLGHPPFGHAGEYTLNALVESKGDADGFEGNAQTFRIITKLAVRFPESDGLDLTRVTLAACLKYPWFRNKAIAARTDKWGAYQLDRQDFEFARERLDHDEQTLEAALMDWADDIAYSVHDLEDFHRVGAIPWSTIFSSEGRTTIVEETLAKWFAAPRNAKRTLENAFDKLLIATVQPVFGPLLEARYEATKEQRFALRNLTSFLIGRFLQATHITEAGLQVKPSIQAEVRLLKQIAKQFIISSPILAAQQYGQKNIISSVFHALFESADTTYPNFLPIKLRYIWELSNGNKARFAADCIASMTESEVIALHKRLTGVSAGSVMDPIIR